MIRSVPGRAATSRRIALIGNPNSGKTTVFNALTRLRQKVANYPGVTVEKKEGRLTFDDGTECVVIDLPGTYSLTPHSPDEKIATDVLLGKTDHTPPPDVVVCVVDASNLERNLYLVSQVLDRKLPLVVALNMMDVARADGLHVNPLRLEQELGVRVVPVVASRARGIAELKRAIGATQAATGHARLWRLPAPVEEEYRELAGMLEANRMEPIEALHAAIALLATPSSELPSVTGVPPSVLAHVKLDHAKLDALGVDRESVFIESRYDWIKNVCNRAVGRSETPGIALSDRIDRVVTHKVWGMLIFVGIMALMFQSIFSWATAPMQWISSGFDWLGRSVTSVMPAGDLRSLIVDGGIAGVAAVVTFLPQILFLFFFLGLLEDTGYMARAAFIMDKLMSKVGLHGKSFIPLLSSFACAVPAIMSTRTIENPRDRLVTMLVAPLMSCSARLPVYTLLIAAFVPGVKVFGILSLAGITLFSMYMLGLVTALAMAWLFKKTLLRGVAPVFIMELPPYKVPSLRSLLLHMWERAVIFLKRAGTIILGVSVILWFLATYPKLEHASSSQQLRHSFAGTAGHLLEPVIRPLGFDWKIGIGLVGSLLQREVFVSTMGTIYNIQNARDTEGNVSLRQQLQSDSDPVTGKPVWSPLTAVCLMVYYVLAMQCMSTVAVMRRETNGWKWPVFQVGYMTALAYSVTFVVFRVGLLLGYGG